MVFIEKRYERKFWQFVEMIPCDKFLRISLYSLGKVSRSQWWRGLDTNAIFFSSNLQNERAITIIILKKDACKFVWSWMMIEMILCDQIFSISSQSLGKSSRLQLWRRSNTNTMVWVQLSKIIELSSLLYWRMMPASSFGPGWWW